MPEPTPTPPEDLVRLRADWLAAEEAHRRVCKEANGGAEIKTPPPVPVHAVSPVEKWVTKLYLPTEDQLDRRAEAYGRLLGLTREIADHTWWGTLEPGTRAAAEIAVRRSALKLHEQSLTAA